MLQRALGRGVTLVSSGDGVARSVERALAARGLREPADAARAIPLPLHRRRGRRSRRSARRFLQMPLGEVMHVELGAGWRHEYREARERSYGRAADQLRPVTIEPGFVRTATGSALISMGETRVICTASVQESVPRWLMGSGRGWVTAEYGMLPASTGERKQRDVSQGTARRALGRDPAPDRALASRRGRLRGARRAHRLHRLRRAPGRRWHALRLDHRRHGRVRARVQAADRRGQARALAADGHRRRRSLAGSSAAVPLLDLDYSEDSSAEVDANVVMTGEGGLVEVQATAERTPLSRAHLDDLLALAAKRDRAAPRAQDRREPT